MEDLNITDIVRNEVRAALKEIIAKTLREEVSNVLKSGDYQTKDKKPLDDTIARPKNEVTEYQLPVKVVKPDGTVEHRRRKRTQAEMREAINKALPVVKEKHPDWSERRQRRLAKNLVRRYKI